MSPLASPSFWIGGRDMTTTETKKTQRCAFVILSDYVVICFMAGHLFYQSQGGRGKLGNGLYSFAYEGLSARIKI